MPAFGDSLLGGPSPRSRAGPLTAGIPDPAAVQRQKESYARSLEEQLRKGVEVLAATHKQQTDLLHAQANEEKNRFNVAMDQEVKQRELGISQQYNEQLMRLQQAAQTRRAELDQQACGLTLEYQQQKVEQECASQQQRIQMQHLEAQARLNAQIEKLAVPGSLLAGKSSAVVPMANYALPSLMPQPPSWAAPVPTGVLPYVPPPGAPTALPMTRPSPVLPGAIPGLVPRSNSRASLSYVPPGIPPPAIPVPPAFGRRVGSFVPPSTGSFAQTGSYVPPSVVL